MLNASLGLMKPIEEIKQAVDSFEAVTWSTCGGTVLDKSDEKYIECGWVKFGLQKTETGWRTLEFLAWTCTDMMRAGERLEFFPTAPPPYLNEPGDCLSFVIEVYPKEGDQDQRFHKVAQFINQCRNDYWEQCKQQA
jgi:hypothetical protein